MNANYQKCAEDYQHPNVKAMLKLIGDTEGTDMFAAKRGVTAYQINVGGGVNKKFPQHPGPQIIAADSTASGKYQFLYDTWQSCSQALGLKDMSPYNQDLAAVYLMGKGQCNAIEHLKKGDLVKTFNRLCWCWASIPTYSRQFRKRKNKPGYWVERGQSYYRQHMPYTLEQLKTKFEMLGGSGFFFSSPDKLNPRTQPSGLPGQSWLSWLFGG